MGAMQEQRIQQLEYAMRTAVGLIAALQRDVLSLRQQLANQHLATVFTLRWFKFQQTVPSTMLGPTGQPIAEVARVATLEDLFLERRDAFERELIAEGEAREADRQADAQRDAKAAAGADTGADPDPATDGAPPEAGSRSRRPH